MNLVFAVIFAAIAYRIGVSYTPCVVGGVAMGSPAWEQGWQQGDKIIGIDDEVTSEHLRFDWDLVQDVAISGSGSKPKPLKITLRTSDGSKRTDEVTASTELKKDFGPVTIGVRPVASTVLADEMPVWKHRVAGRTKTAFQSGDRVVAVDKKPLQQDPETKEFWVHDLTRRLTTKIDQPVVLTVERSRQDAAQEKQRIDITVNPAPMVQVGLVMEMGPITAIKRGSLAEKWKIQKGDWLLKVNGEAVDDPLTLPQHFAALAGQPVKLEFQRDGRSILKEVDALGVEYYLPYMGLGAKTGLESIGIAYEVRPVVQRVLPESSADRAGMQAGDEVIHVQFSHSPTNPEERLLFEKYFEKGYRYAESLDLETTPLSWIDVHHGLQQALPGTKVVVKYRRGKEMKDATLEGEDSQVSFFPIRGLNFVGLERTCRSDSWLSATALGFRETKIQLTRVQVFLVKLFKGQISVKNLGGPVIIATIAGGEAAQGIPRLLIFLTFLSANLAILNFLPIPALDGGHMVFLIFEGISGRPVNERIQGVLTLGGVACLLALMVFVLGNDIYRLFL